MPTYILLSTLSTQGVQTLKSNPERLREVNRDVADPGLRGSTKIEAPPALPVEELLAAPSE